MFSQHFPKKLLLAENRFCNFSDHFPIFVSVAVQCRGLAPETDTKPKQPLKSRQFQGTAGHVKEQQ